MNDFPQSFEYTTRNGSQTYVLVDTQRRSTVMASWSYLASIAQHAGNAVRRSTTGAATIRRGRGGAIGTVHCPDHRRHTTAAQSPAMLIYWPSMRSPE
jgi:hypothetical protein